MNYNICVNNYNIFLDINLIKLIYRGFVLISIKLIKKANLILINSKDFVINSIKIDKIDYFWEINNDEEIIIIRNDLGFESDKEYIIKINFDWKQISNEIDGFYYTKKNNKIVCTTHLEPISARKFIPCFDHPNLKAHFNMVIKIDFDFECISNTSIKKINYDKTGKNKYIYYNITPLMSTYLLCLVCGNIKSNIKSLLTKPIISKSGILINGYCIDDDTKYISWSIKRTVEALDFFESWFGIKYPLEKLDIVSIPNFSSGAMENWGIITFREEYVLLYNKKNYLSQVKILEVIYHEIAHQWFGNLVTLSNWGDLWLNEATASFFSWMALLLTYDTTYNIMEFYWLLEFKNVYLIDAFTNTHSIIMNDIEELNPSELFDEITYSKGNIIINYIANLLGLDNFQKAIQKYLNMYLYSNPSTGNKLFEYFNKYSTNKNIDYVDLMNKLISTKGYPILYIKKNNNEYNFTYKTFNLNKNIIIDYPVNLFLKIKYFEQIEIIDLRLNNYVTNGDELNYLINPNNELFCICYYDNFKPNLKIMSQTELMKYSHDEFILGLYGYKDLDNYLNCIGDIFNLINMNDNSILCYSILSDIIHLMNIYIYSNCEYTKIIIFLKNNLDDKLTIQCNDLLSTSTNKYSEFVLENILTIKIIKFNDINLINMIKNMYDYQNDLIIKSSSYFNHYYLSKIIFNVIMKYYQDTEFNYLLNILKTCSNTQIIDNIIGSFLYLNDNNFNIVFNNYSQLIKSQDYHLFFSSISKIVSKQEFIIDYWIYYRYKISSIDEITFNILKNISKNIFDLRLIKKILNYLKLILDNKNKLIIDKIKDILTTNKIIILNIKKHLL